MILTDKAKVDFHIWMDREKRDLRKSYLDDTCYNALIIEWLDSVGITIEIGVYHDDMKDKPFSWSIFCDHSTESDNVFTNRNDCMENAIQKATEIYNKQ